MPDRIFIKQEYQEADLANHDDIVRLCLRFGSEHAYAAYNLRLIYSFYCSFYYSFYYATACMLLQRSSAIRGCVRGLHFAPDSVSQGTQSLCFTSHFTTNSTTKARSVDVYAACTCSKAPLRLYCGSVKAPLRLS